MNNYHTKLNFTIEKEENNSIAYLDMKIHRENNKILTNWYTKSIASGRLINYNSTQPLRQKINTATNLIIKAINLSDTKFIPENITKIRNILTKNNYPKHLINNLISTVSNNKNLRGNIIENTSENTSGNTKYFSLAYIPKLTENKKLREIITDEGVRLAHKPNKTINSLFTKTKTPIENKEQSNVVYEIQCNGNTDEGCTGVYVGTTKRSLGKRLDEHEADIRKQKQTTALAIHCFENNHTADLSNVKILDREKRTNKRYTIESLRIQQRNTSAINRREDMDNINANYILAIS